MRKFMARGGTRKGAGRPCGAHKTKPIRVPEKMVDSILDFISTNGHKFPLYSSTVSAGFPSPAEDHVETKLDLHELLIKRPTTTFFVRVSGESMLKAGIHPGDILIVDKSIPAASGKIVIAAIDGHLTVKRLMKSKQGDYQLMPENDQFKPINISADNNVHIWGVVTNVIHPV